MDILDEIFYYTALIGVFICLMIDSYDVFVMHKFKKLSKHIKKQESRRLE